MAANVNPIFQRLGDVSTNGTTGMSQIITLAANDYTGAGANNVLVFTADATNGSWIERLRIKPTGTNVASVLRIFLNNGATNGTATNNAFHAEISLPACTISATSALYELDYPMGFALNPGYKIYVGLGTAQAAGVVVTAVGGPY